MSFWKFVVLIFVFLNFYEYLKNIRKIILMAGKMPSGLWLQVLLILVMNGLFVYSILFSPSSFVPKFFSWATISGFWSLFWVTVLSCTLFALFYIYVFQKELIAKLSPSERRDLVFSKNRLYDSFVGSLRPSISAGLLEEYLYRFYFFIILQPVVAFVLGLINMLTVLSFFPQWLFLGAVSLVTPSVFITALILNFLFALAHKEVGEKRNLWHRVIMAWFMGWVFFIAIVNFGLLGAILCHILADVVEFTVMTLFLSKLVEDDYRRTG